jgi:hypothetical protein
MTSAAVRVAESGDTDYRLFQGNARAETKAGEKLVLSSSEAVKVDAEGKASPKVALPGIPLLMAPSHQTEIAYPDPAKATTLLLWTPVPDAASYHLMLDYSAHFNRPLVDRKGIKESQQQLRGLDAGKYYWRVAAIDKSGQEGAFSDFAKFTVTGSGTVGSGEGPPPPLQIEALDLRQNILQVKGRTEPGATVTVNGMRVEVEDDGGFNDYITLEKQGKQVVVIRAVGLNGGVNEQKRPVMVGF